MRQEDYFLFGKIFKANGYKGAVSIYNSQNIDLNINDVKYCLISIEGILTPYFVEHIISKKDIIIIKFEEVNSKKDSLPLIKKDAFLPNSITRKNNNYKSLMNYKIIDKSLGEIGIISQINELTPQKLIIGKNKDKTFFIPFHDNFLLNINHQNKSIEVNISKDLLNLN
ncbi:MAG: hypothetical protein VX347_00770 [Bacteroidota bacterium]|nr:hypothetical protein [Bacteroidota bacterium]